MALLGYTLFREKLLDGSKTQTIRKLRKLKDKPHPIKLGEHLYHYWKLRTKECRKLLESTCSETFFVIFYWREGEPRVDWFRTLHSPHMVMSDEGMMKLAKRDGPDNVQELFTVLERMHGVQNGKQIFQVIRW
jgi:hypothetical protein